MNSSNVLECPHLKVCLLLLEVGRCLEDVEHLPDVVVQLFGLADVLPDPVAALEVDVLDQERIEGVDVAADQVPLLLDFPLNLLKVK